MNHFPDPTQRPLPRAAGILLAGLLLTLLGLSLSEPPGRPQATASPDLSAYPWVYLRDDRPLEASEALASMIAVGDVMPGRGTLAEQDPLGEVSGWLGAADLTLGNLETVLVDGGEPRRAPASEPQPILLQAPESTAWVLARAGIDLLGLANNHSLDYGPAGLAATVAALEGAGIIPVGWTEDGTVAPRVISIRGVRLAFLAVNAVPDPAPELACPPPAPCAPRPVAWNSGTVLPAITAARDSADAVVVSVHWGQEYERAAGRTQQEIAAAMQAAGADLVVGHHPHVAQPFGAGDVGVVAYSLGNFLFDQADYGADRGLALRAFFDEEGLRAVQALPVVAGLRPRLAAPDEAEWLAGLLPAPARVGYACTDTGCVPATVPQETATGLFYGGQIDLTGDGVPEIVRRQGERVTVYEGGEAIWESPEAWRVVDAALGDPNDDGRFEMMLAIWQADGAGYERSQPYLVGHRGGQVALLWGGRPVVDPIQELALGDIDGDDRDELVVIEELADGSGQAVAVWEWAGWTFTLIWRSELGRYRDLVLVDQSAGPPLLSVVRTR